MRSESVRKRKRRKAVIFRKLTGVPRAVVASTTYARTPGPSYTPVSFNHPFLLSVFSIRSGRVPGGLGEHADREELRVVRCARSFCCRARQRRELVRQRGGEVGRRGAAGAESALGRLGAGETLLNILRGFRPFKFGTCTSKRTTPSGISQFLKTHRPEKRIDLTRAPIEVVAKVFMTA